MKANTIKKIVAIAIPVAAVVACAHAGIKANKIASKKVKEAYTEFETNLNNIETAVKMHKEDPSVDYSMDDAKTDTIATYVIFARKTITAYAPVVGAALAGSAAIGAAYLIHKHVTLSRIMNVLVNRGNYISGISVGIFCGGLLNVKLYTKIAKESEDEDMRNTAKGLVIANAVAATVGAAVFVGVNRVLVKHARVIAELTDYKGNWIGHVVDILSGEDVYGTDHAVWLRSNKAREIANFMNVNLFFTGLASIIDTKLFGFPCVFTIIASGNMSGLYRANAHFTKYHYDFLNYGTWVGVDGVVVGKLRDPWAWMSDASRAKYAWVKF